MCSDLPDFILNSAMPPKDSVRAFVVAWDPKLDDFRVLVGTYAIGSLHPDGTTKKGMTGIPGGTIEPKQTLKAAVLDEVRDETGCLVKLLTDIEPYTVVPQGKSYLTIHYVMCELKRLPNGRKKTPPWTLPRTREMKGLRFASPQKMPNHTAKMRKVEADAWEVFAKPALEAMAVERRKRAKDRR